MKLASFDLETARATAEGEPITDVGISCAGIAYSDTRPIDMIHCPGKISQEHAELIVELLSECVDEGYTIITWNGCGFDFRILAEESGMIEECAALAMNHVDMMLLVTFQKGYYLGLDPALLGMGVEGKLHEVTLSDGSIVDDFSGAQVPELWSAGEYDAVLTYLKSDIERPLELARRIIRDKEIRWISAKGNPMRCAVQKFWTVKECFKLPTPKTSWMTDPPTRHQFVEWMAPDDAWEEIDPGHADKITGGNAHQTNGTIFRIWGEEALRIKGPSLNSKAKYLLKNGGAISPELDSDITYLRSAHVKISK